MKDQTTHIENAGITRRELGQLGLGVVLAASGLSLGARRARAEDEPMITEIPENAPIVQALAYKAKSDVEGAKCANCALYLGGDAPQGKCGLFPKGVVSAEGHCSSWSKKSA